MKTAVFRIGLCLSPFLFLSLSVQSKTPQQEDPTGIKFFTGSWKDVLAEAKRQNKPVFVDIYTTWCGPCKLMAKQAFPDAKVGEKFNANFVSYQIDAEKGEGLDVAKKYAVEAYPTSLYVAANGDLIHRSIGYGGIKGMLDEADKAIEAAKDPNPLSAMEIVYAGGKRDQEFVEAYLKKRASHGLPNGDALAAYLKTIPESDWTSDKTLDLITGNTNTYNPRLYTLLHQKLIQLKDATDKPTLMYRNKVSESIGMLSQAHFKQAVADKNEQILVDVINTHVTYISVANGRVLTRDEVDEQADYLYRSYYQKTGELGKYEALVVKEATKLMKLTTSDFEKLNEAAYQRFEEQTRSQPDSIKQSPKFKKRAASVKQTEPRRTADRLNGVAWGYYETITDKKALEEALIWSAKSLEYDRNSMSLDTYAHLLSKLGRKNEAIKAQEEAIALEKAAGGNSSGYEKDLEIMKQK